MRLSGVPAHSSDSTACYVHGHKVLPIIWYPFYFDPAKVA